MDISEVISLIDRPEAEWEVERDCLRLPWDIKPEEYLAFAKQDIEAIDKRGTVNALSNAKRALECQVDSLLIAFGLERTKRMNLPAKLEALRDVAIIAPRILSKLNRYRNEMEHQFSCPPHDVASDFVDVVDLFIEATKFHINDRRCSWQFWQTDFNHLKIELQKNGLRAIRSESKEWLEVSADSDDYKAVLKAIGRVTKWEL